MLTDRIRSQTMAEKRTVDISFSSTQIARIIVPVALCVAGAWLLSPYWLSELAVAFIYVVATLGTDLIFGRTGILSLCQASFIGLGAYVAAAGSAHGIGLGLQLLITVGICIIAGAAIAVPTLRLSGLRLAIVTLLFGELFEWFIDEKINLTGGSEGMAVLPLHLGPINSLLPRPFYLFCLGLALLATLAVWQLSRGQWNRRLLSCRDAPLAASSVGINTTRVRIQVMMVGGIFCGIAGVFYAYANGFVVPSDFDTFPSAYLLVAVILGGSGTLLGPWLGAMYVILLPSFFSLIGEPNFYALLGGVVLVVFTMALPGGIVSIARSAAVDRLVNLNGTTRFLFSRRNDSSCSK